MSTRKYQVDFYETIDGKQPAKKFLLSLDYAMRAKMISTISILQDNGPELRKPYSEHIILTNGFVEKTQKTPQEEIEKAKRYRADYLERKEEDDEHKV